MDYLISASGKLLLSPVPQSYMKPRVVAFSKEVNNKGGAMDNCFGFIDYTILVVALSKK